MLNRVFRGRNDGFYVDVGAADPEMLSVTKMFYDRGWSGINIEPHPEFYQRLIAMRPNDINLNCGAGTRSGEAAFFELPVKEWSSFDPTVRARATTRGERTTKRTIPILPLNEILKRHLNNRTIDFLKIDVEGWEREVLSGINLQRHRPTVIVVEATCQGTQESNHSMWEDILTAAQYKSVYFDGVNRFYLPQEQDNLAKYFAVPPNAFDEFVLADTGSAMEQIKTLNKLLSESDADRAARYEQIQQLTVWLKDSEATRMAQLEKIQILETLLKETEADRTLQLENVRQLESHLAIRFSRSLSRPSNKRPGKPK
jgi:FkbM family methyltransferase